jgi:hypothetical protein
MHVPATSWHPHADRTFEVKKPTEWEAWAHLMRAILLELTHGNGRLMVGYWADALNTLPPEVRTAMVSVLAQGLGLEIRPAKDTPDTIEITLVHRYPPLVGEQKTESGLILPKKGTGGKPDLILPNDPRFGKKEK